MESQKRQKPMVFELVPLLQHQRDLYRLPQGMERFRAYLDRMLNADGSDVDLLPMVTMNPMGKDHVPERLDALMAMDAETVATQAIAAAVIPDGDEGGSTKLGLVVADDALGGWTNRYTCEFSARFEMAQSLKRGWLSVVLWTSGLLSRRKVREETLTVLYRAAYARQHGTAGTLQEMLNQEGYAMAMAGCEQPALDADDLAYSQDAIAPHLSTQDYPTIVACLFGDTAARSLGYPPQGLSDWAGLALALHMARGDTSCRFV